VLHENPDWFPPIEAALRAEGVPHEQWLLGDGTTDLGGDPPDGVFWSRISASSHTRGHPFAKDHARALLSWLEAHGRRVVNGRRVLELEVSKADQLTALRAAGFDVPRTVAVAGRDRLIAAAAALPVPFISKHNQGGKGLGVRRFDSHEQFAGYVSGAGFEPPADGIMLLQEYVPSAAPFVTRVEIVGGEFVYAITADTSSGSFELCPAEACATGPAFALRVDFDPRLGERYADFARRHGIEIAGFEFIETPDGRIVTYDVNTTTNYNPAIEAVAPRPALGQVARYLGRLLAGLVPMEVNLCASGTGCRCSAAGCATSATRG
jgi:glutathione synthase/RimK-type ligase-like ATP-grasp enzyme